MLFVVQPQRASSEKDNVINEELPHFHDGKGGPILREAQFCVREEKNCYSTFSAIFVMTPCLPLLLYFQRQNNTSPITRIGPYEHHHHTT
jgi:hypothetical protein